MQNRHSLLWAVWILLSVQASAQTTFIPTWAKENRLFDRMEIKAQRYADLNLGTAKPLMRKTYAAIGDSVIRDLDSNRNPWKLTKRDIYNLTRFMGANRDYAAINKPEWRSKDYLKKNLYVTPGNLFEDQGDAGNVVINPVLAGSVGYENNDQNTTPYRMALGVSGRALIARHVGLDVFAVRIQEEGAQPFRDFLAMNKAVPGAVKYSRDAGKTSVGYWDLRASVSTHVTKYIDIQFGQDRQFIGNGYRSLLLSDFSGNNLFLKFNTRIWRLNYTNLYQKLNTTPIDSLRQGLANKFSSMHHLSINITKWLTVGAFEAIVFRRDKGTGYDLSYLQPLIFLRSMEQQNGSPDNANIGFDIKANIAKTAQFYGQFMLDEFVKDEVIGSSRNWWGNKQALQLGLKYVDAFGVDNLDLQVEMNQVRPFMYQFRDTAGAYTHATQPLAHPLGGNLREFVGLLRYQPTNKLWFDARVNYWKQGLDSAGYNFGANPNELYTAVQQGGNRLRNDNYPLFAGKPATGLNASLVAAYELRENFFLEAQGMFRNYKETDKDAVNRVFVQIGFRWNMYRRDYDY